MEKGTKKVVIITIASLAVVAIGVFAYMKLKGAHTETQPLSMDVQKPLQKDVASAPETQKATARAAKPEDSAAPTTRPLVNIVRKQ